MMTWLPLLDLPEAGLTAGVLKGWWCVRGQDDGPHYIDSSPVAFLRFLEVSLGDLHRRLDDALREVELDHHVRPVWPTEQMIKIGLSAWGQHWPKLALDRLDEDGGFGPFLDELADVARRGESQTIRHRAQKLARVAARKRSGK